MSEELRTKYEVIRILRDLLLGGLVDMGLEGWDCMEFGQASFQSADKILTLNMLRTDNVGYSGKSYVMVDNALYEQYEQLEEQHWQVQVILKRENSPVSSDTVTAEDAAQKIIMWINGPGIAKFRTKGVGLLRVDANNVFVYNDDSTVYQKRAVFTVKIQVPKVFRIGQDALDVIKPDILPV